MAWHWRQIGGLEWGQVTTLGHVAGYLVERSFEADLYNMNHVSEPPAYEDAIADLDRELHPSGHQLSDVISGPDCEWVKDDFPLWGAPSNDLSEVDKQLRDWAVTNRTVVTNGLAYYVYCRNAASWAQIESTQAACELLERTNTMAPVNYSGALKKFHPLLKRVAYPVGQIDTSICIGTWRLTFTVSYEEDGRVVRYKRHQEAIPNPRGPEHVRVYTFPTHALSHSKST